MPRMWKDGKVVEYTARAFITETLCSVNLNESIPIYMDTLHSEPTAIVVRLWPKPLTEHTEARITPIPALTP